MDEAQQQQQQQLECQEAQKIAIGEDLLAAAKRQLKFLQAVDRKRCLYDDGPVLDRAIHRYKTCWLPLLAEHGESGMLDGPLAVPLDGEWIWHCHRLNRGVSPIVWLLTTSFREVISSVDRLHVDAKKNQPCTCFFLKVQYKKDCEQVYGRILSKRNVVSSAEGNCQQEATEIWSKLYPNEPFELDYTSPLSCSNADNRSMTEDTIKYDLISAVMRQSTFYYQVSRPSMHDDRFLKDAVARYKGFMHLIKRNQERSLKRFHVPTYDIDLIWHSHQLHSPSYCKDMVDILGRVLEHDDIDSDRTKGKKLDVGFSETTKQWEETYGLRYWRSGAMYRGNLPSPLMVTTPNYVTKNTTSPVEYQKHLQLPYMKVVEVCFRGPCLHSCSLNY